MESASGWGKPIKKSANPDKKESKAQSPAPTQTTPATSTTNGSLSLKLFL